MEAVLFIPNEKQVSFVKKNLPSEPVGNEVLIKVAYSGICGTDLHICEGEFPCKSTEFTLGHEFCGLAQSIGPEVTHLKPGDPVVVDPNSGCRTCSYCTSGRYHLCQNGAIKSTIGIFQDGGWAEFCLVPGHSVFKIPDGITLEQAVLTEPISCVAHGWNRIGPLKIGQNILVQGAGIIGNLWAAVLHLQGHKNVTVSEPNERRRKLAAKLGTSFNYVSPLELTDYKADIVIDCSGSAKAIESAVNILNPGGKLCVFGVAPPDAKMSVSPYQIYLKELTIVGVMINPYAIPDAFGLIEAMGTRYLSYDHLGIKVFSLKDYKSAFESLKKGEVAKVVFKI